MSGPLKPGYLFTNPGLRLDKGRPLTIRHHIGPAWSIRNRQGRGGGRVQCQGGARRCRSTPSTPSHPMSRPRTPFRSTCANRHMAEPIRRRLFASPRPVSSRSCDGGWSLPLHRLRPWSIRPRSSAFATAFSRGRGARRDPGPSTHARRGSDPSSTCVWRPNEGRRFGHAGLSVRPGPCGGWTIPRPCGSQGT